MKPFVLKDYSFYKTRFKPSGEEVLQEISIPSPKSGPSIPNKGEGQRDKVYYAAQAYHGKRKGNRVTHPPQTDICFRFK
jgi:hypothetical protein